MKKVLLFAVILGGAVAFTSCGKDECECTYNGQTETFNEDDVNGGDLEEACNAADALYKIADSSASCKMK
ncbi:MAG: hypothetical protein KDD41_08810 [Flavobacteriales bacterium]|nr:hypothetical protein [Flavobacteriales bacterium]